MHRPLWKKIAYHKYSIVQNQKHLSTSLGRYIANSNPIISGWCNYYRFSNASDTFDKVSRWLYFRTSKWLLRKGWSVAKIEKHLHAQEGHQNNPCRFAGGWFWYLGSLKLEETF